MKRSRLRSDNIPFSHVMGMSDDYLTGYVQSLIDMHYYEFCVRVIVRQGTVYVFNLPNNTLISSSILCFIYDIPCVGCVQRVRCCPSKFIAAVAQYDEEAAEEIICSEAYRSMCSMPLPHCQIRGIW